MSGSHRSGSTLCKWFPHVIEQLLEKIEISCIVGTMSCYNVSCSFELFKYSIDYQSEKVKSEFWKILQYKPDGSEGLWLSSAPLFNFISSQLRWQHILTVQLSGLNNTIILDGDWQKSYQPLETMQQQQQQAPALSHVCLSWWTALR